MKKTHSLSVVLLLGATLTLVARASASETYAVDWWTVDGGGETYTSSGGCGLRGTIGQADAGEEMTGGGYALTGGFWVGAGGSLEPVSISGNAGTGGATLSYVVCIRQTVSADGGGNYSITVPPGWSGTVTPSEASCTFTPTDKSYSNVASNRPGEDYAASCAPVITEGESVNASTTETGFPYPFDLTLHATDLNSDTLSWSLGSPASHGTASVSGTGLSMAIMYAPLAGYNGTDSFVVVVSDGTGGSDSITVNVTIVQVTPQDQLPLNQASQLPSEVIDPALASPQGSGARGLEGSAGH